MSDVKFTKDHEWIRMEGDIAVCGITTYAQEQLGDVVYVELPEIGKALEAGKDAAVVESVKAASEVYAPIDGEVVEVNEALNDNPGLVNEEPEAGAWFLKLKPTKSEQLTELMDKAAYHAFVEGLD
ncbi:MAG: glycine cleavage system protein GcvH [Alphaproteobacteria bacterium]|nr:glycine cleavage system protein GcvH [Alphaproteobacteria bacterium SS10]